MELILTWIDRNGRETGDVDGYYAADYFGPGDLVAARGLLAAGDRERALAILQDGYKGSDVDGIGLRWEIVCPMPEKSTLGSRLRALRKFRAPKLTQAEAADAIGISRSHLAHLENDHHPVGRDMLGVLATYYRVTIHYLVSGNGEPATMQQLKASELIALLAQHISLRGDTPVVIAKDTVEGRATRCWSDDINDVVVLGDN